MRCQADQITSLQLAELQSWEKSENLQEVQVRIRGQSTRLKDVRQIDPGIEILPRFRAMDPASIERISGDRARRSIAHEQQKSYLE